MSDKDNNSKEQKEIKKAHLLSILKGKISIASELYTNRAKEKSSIDQLLEIFNDAEIFNNKDGKILKRVIQIDLNNPYHERGYKIEVDFNNICFSSEDLVKITNNILFKNLNLSDLSFLDIETTGLAGGSGTYPFLVGVGFFRNNYFIVEQYFMPDYPDEYAQMNLLKDVIRQFKALVTYNGKTFDVPVLKARFIYHRIKSVWDMPNWDLLHISRRLWRKRFHDCTLSTIEKEILKIERLHDIDGSLIPQIYFDYLRGIRIDRMIPVFDHNAQDIISLAVLAVKFLDYMKNPEMEDLKHPSDQLGLHKINLETGNIDEALACLERALFFSREDEQTQEILIKLARFYKKLERWDEAIEIWTKQMFGKASINSFEAFIETAKYYEHKTRELGKALEVMENVEKYISLTKQMVSYELEYSIQNDDRLTKQIEDIKCRKKRIMKKLGKL